MSSKVRAYQKYISKQKIRALVREPVSVLCIRFQLFALFRLNGFVENGIAQRACVANSQRAYFDGAGIGRQ